MNICECGCGQECQSRFIRGHNGKKQQPNIPTEVVQRLELAKEIPEPIVEYTQNYTLIDVPKDVIINYEAGKKWLEKTFENYYVFLNHDENELPCEIVLSAWSFLDEAQTKRVHKIGIGNTFSNALKELLSATI